ncbi:ankyrin repeat-containing domain protein [Mycena rosella]|uniref:Ankyrin repeat-containing domain protein n=1 Tax=Mycena rosella TaxID=1033263 RepID=A0AAD7CXT9_MYCRO|nr:ankyrin repeat-containing domain protein [Mycena rosella]
MKQKHLETLQLRKDGTGIWLLEGDMLNSWQDNPGLLWIMGQSGTGKSVLSSAVISKLQHDAQIFQAMKNCPPPAIAFFYFDFKDKEGQAMDSALRRIVLQLSAQSVHPHRALEQQYKSKSTGQTLPTYQDLLNILEELLQDIGRTYIVLDALDECKENDHRRLVDFISTLRRWSTTPLHLLITSQPRHIFTNGFGDVPSIMLESHLVQDDIRLFVVDELQSFPSWAHRAADRVVSKSNGMFRLAACLIVEISHCEWEDKLDKTLDHLPNDLFGIYDRFLQAIRPESFVHAAGALRWIIFSRSYHAFGELADAIAFDFSDPTQYIYKPSRREGNQSAIPKWFEGLAVFTEDSVTLTHASVEDYLLSTQFGDRFGCNLSASHSHTFIAQTCIAYLLHFSDNWPDEVSDNSLSNASRNYPLAYYAAMQWCHHLLRSQNQTLLFAGAMRLLEDGSPQYLRALLAKCADPYAAEKELGTYLYEASKEGHLEIVRLLLENGADVNMMVGGYGSALQAASARGHTDIIHPLLKNGADVNTPGGYYGSALQAASAWRHMDIVRLLLENGAHVNATGGKYGSALQAASRWGLIEIVRLLLENGADVNAPGGKFGSALQAASARGYTDLVRLLLENGADLNTTGGEYGTALQVASFWDNTDIVEILREKGANDVEDEAI